MYQVRTFLSVIALAVLSPAYSQTTCSSPTLAPASCSGGNGAAFSGANITGTNVFWFSAGPSTFSSLNLAGGTLRICGNLTVTSMNINSGTIVIEQGGIFTISGSFNVGNLTIINRGTLNINGSLTLQGSGNTVCLQNNAIFNVSTFTNNVTNSITYAGSGATACFSVSGAATLNNTVTASSKIGVCKSSSAPSAGWGAATVVNGCASCATVLALTINDLTAPNQYYRIRTVTASGNKVYSIIALASTGLAEEKSFAIYPNPAGSNGQLYIKIADGTAGSIAQLYLMDATGRTVSRNASPLMQGNNLLTWRLQNLRPGIYFLKVTHPGGKDHYSPVTIMEGN